jgi:hypothetical protein
LNTDSGKSKKVFSLKPESVFNLFQNRCSNWIRMTVQVGPEYAQAQCHASGQVNPGDYGRIVRINITEQNRRIFVPTPHGSPSWQRGYARRSALERINNRIDNSLCFEKHFIRGQAKMKTRMGLALAVMMAMALGHVKAGRIEQMRSLVKPIRQTG